MNQRPSAIQMVLDLNCNNTCNICGASWLSRESWTHEQVVECIQKGIQEDIRQIIFSGGEPTLRPDLPAIVKQAKLEGYGGITLLTNGRKFEKVEYLAALIEAGITGIGTTLYGHLPEIHESITGARGSFSQTINGIRNIRESAATLPLSVNIVVTRENYRDLVQTVQLLLGLEVRSIQVTYVVPVGRAIGIFSRQTMPKMTETIPFLRRAIQEFIGGTSKKAHASITSAYYPRCILGDLAPFSGDEDPALIAVYTRDKTFIPLSELLRRDNLYLKTTRCKQCQETDRCIGLWSEYASIHGWIEIPSGEKEQE